MTQPKAVVGTLPAGAVAPTHTLQPGPIVLSVLKLVSDGGRDKEIIVDGVPLPPTEFGERFYAHVEYPGGFIREHQVKTTEDLIVKITSQLRARYGVNPTKVTSRPDLAEGIEIVMEA